LKTGHLDDENFTAAITAQRGEMRLIAVLLGVPGHSLAEGARNRTEDSLALLSYGFQHYSTIALDAPALPPVRVWKGQAREIAMAPAAPVRLTASREELSRLTYSVLARMPLVAPVLKGQKVGDLLYSAGDDEVRRVPLLAATDVEEAGPVRWTWDSISLGLFSLLEDTSFALHAALDSLQQSTIVSAGKSASIERRTP